MIIAVVVVVGPDRASSMLQASASNEGTTGKPYGFFARKTLIFRRTL